MSGEFLCLFNRRLRRAKHSRAAAGGRARAAGAAAYTLQIRIAFAHTDTINVNAELFGDDLLVDGIVPLPLADGASEHHDVARFVDADGGFLHRGAPGAFDGVGNTHAAQLATRFRVLPARIEPGIVDHVQR